MMMVSHPLVEVVEVGCARVILGDWPSWRCSGGLECVFATGSERCDGGLCRAIPRNNAVRGSQRVDDGVVFVFVGLARECETR
jgi:hypothetical protein